MMWFETYTRNTELHRYLINMRMNYLKKIFFTLGIVLPVFGFGQASMHIYTGLANGINHDKIFAASGTGHFGFLGGLELRTNSDELYFLFNGEYGLLNPLPTKFNYFASDNVTFSKLKIGLGVDVKKLSRKRFIRTKLQGTLISLNKLDPNLLKQNPLYVSKEYQAFNENLAGLQLGLGYHTGKWNMQIEYEAGFYNFISQKKDTKISFINLIVGYKLF